MYRPTTVYFVCEVVNLRTLAHLTVPETAVCVELYIDLRVTRDGNFLIFFVHIKYTYKMAARLYAQFTDVSALHVTAKTKAFRSAHTKLISRATSPPEMRTIVSNHFFHEKWSKKY